MSMVTADPNTAFTGPVIPLRTTLSARSPITTVPSEAQVTVNVTELPLLADAAVVVHDAEPLT